MYTQIIGWVIPKCSQKGGWDLNPRKIHPDSPLGREVHIREVSERIELESLMSGVFELEFDLRSIASSSGVADPEYSASMWSLF